MNRKILIFAMASYKKEAIRLIGQNLGAVVVEVLPREYNQQIGYLAGISGFKRAAGKYKGPAFAEEMMVLCGMNSELVDEFLAACRSAELASVDRKAMITPTNASWTPDVLYAELSKEHKEMHP